jgi:hypothetical protein
MPGPNDSFSADYLNHHFAEVDRLEEEENERLVIRQQLREQQAMFADQAATEANPVEGVEQGEEQDTAGLATDLATGFRDGMFENATEEETSVISDMGMGFLNGIRDAGVNTAQLGIDILTLGQSDVDLDEQVPDVDDRESAAFGLTSGITQFATGFVPVLGVMSKLNKVKKVGDMVSRVRGAGAFGRAATSGVAKDMFAGGVADFAVFNPQEARFSDLVEDFGFNNPVTGYLQSDEDDSDFEGRMKNVLEGAGLGLVADGLIRGVKAAKNMKKATRSTLDADVPRDLAEQADQIHQSVVFERQSLEEIDTTINATRETAGEVGPDTPLERVRAEDPNKAIELEEAHRTLVQEQEVYRGEVLARLEEAERSLAEFRASPEYQALPLEVRREWEMIDEYRVDSPEVEQLRARLEEEIPFERATADELPDFADEELELLIERADGSFEVDEEALLRHQARKRTLLQKGGKGALRRVDRLIDMDDPAMFKAVTAIFARGKLTGGRIDEKSLAQLIGANNFNQRRIAGPGGLQQMADELATFVRTHAGLGRRKRSQTFAMNEADKAARKEAELLGRPDTSEELLNNYRKFYKENVEDLDIKMQTIRVLTESTRLNAKQLVNSVIDGTAGDISQAELVLALDNFIQFQNIRDGFVGSAGRVLRAAGETVHAVPILNAKHAKQILDEFGNRDSVTEMALQFRDALETSSGLEAFVRAQKKSVTFRKMALEYWLNAILSGPITQAVNVFSNTVALLYLPAEKAIHGVAKKFLNGDSAGLIDEALWEYQGLVSGWKGAFALSRAGRENFGKALSAQLRRGGNIDQSRAIVASTPDEEMGTVFKSFVADDPQTVTEAKQFDFDEQAAITAGNVRRRLNEKTGGKFKSSIDGALAEDSLGGQIINVIGHVTRMPGRLLTTGDELAKTLNYHMALNKIAHKEARRLGLENVDHELKRLIDGIPQWKTAVDIDDATREAWSELDELAKNYARKNTWTDPLDERGITRSIQNMVIKHPALRIMIPFVRTPANLLNFAAERTPFLWKHTREYKRALEAAGGVKKALKDTPQYAEMRARMFTGIGLYTVAGTLASQGVFTGAGPANPQERAALLATGWQPFSLRLTDDETGEETYVSYNRMDPFGLFLGTAATFGEAVGGMNDNTATEVGVGLVVALAETLQSKAYFQGVTEIVSVLEHPERRTKRWFQKFLGSAVPNLIGSTTRTGVAGWGGDATMREMDGVLDGAIAKLPGYSQDLPPRRNIFGEVITYAMGYGPDTFSPFMTRTSANTKVNREIQRLTLKANYGVSMAGFDNIGGIELTPEQRDRFIVLSSGDPSRNGSDLRDALTKLMRTSQYKKADDGPDGKQAMINKVIKDRRKRGRKAMLKEDPELALAIREQKRQRSMAARMELEEENQDQSGMDSIFGSILGGS